MKKKWLTALFVTALAFALGIMLSACSTASTPTNSNPIIVNEEPIDIPSDSADILNNDKPVIKHTHYLQNTKAVQANSKLEQPDGTPLYIDAELYQTQSVDGIYIMQFRIGEIRNCFIQNITRPMYNDGGIGTVKYTSSMLTSKTVSEGVANSVSTSRSISVAESKSNTLSWSLSATNSVSAKASVGVNVSVFSAKTEIEASFSTTASLANSDSQTSSETIARTIAEESYKNLNIASLQQSYEESAYEIDMSRYELDYYYVLALVADIDVYQIVAYNEYTGEFCSTYFATAINENNTAMRVLASDSASFKIEPDYQLSPISEISIKNIIDKNGKPAIKENTVIVDMSNCYQYSGSTLNNFTHPYFDNKTNTFTAYGSMDSKAVTCYKFIGRYGLMDDKGRTIKKELSGLSIRLFTEHDITLEFENMSFIGKLGEPVIAATNDFNGCYNLTIKSSGIKNKITARNGEEFGQNGCNAIELPEWNIIVNGSSPLEVLGGHGMSGADGKNGAAGAKGSDAHNKHAGTGGNGGNGTNGQDGGSGGVAITALQIDIYCDATFRGGNGAYGGKAGNAGTGGKGGTCWANAGGAHGGAGNGGDAGRPGIGGNGGDAGISVLCKQLNVINGTTTLFNGDGGDAGSPGAPAKGGDGGDAKKWGLYCAWSGGGGSGSIAVDGSNGGNSYTVINASVDKNANLQQNNGNVGKGSAGSRGGAVGAKGVCDKPRNSFESGVDRSNTYGKNGTDGKILSQSL